MAKLERETDVANVLSQMSQLVKYPFENNGITPEDETTDNSQTAKTKEDCEHTYAQNVSKKKFPDKKSRRTSNDGKRKHTCELCGRAFSKLCNMKSHLRVHSGERPHKCELCSSSFANLWDLIRHSRTHSGEKPYKCDHCDRRFSDFGSHRRHIRLHTKDNPYKCTTCEKEFSRLDSYKNHLHTHSEQKPFVCEKCDRTFAYPSTYKRHLNSHSGERKFKCEVCNKSFVRQDYLITHRRKHLKQIGEHPEPESTPLDSVININEGELLLCPSTEIESSSSYSVNADLSPIPILLSMAESAVVTGSICDSTEYLDSSSLLAAASEIELGTSTEISTPRYDVGIDLESCSIIPKSDYQNNVTSSCNDFKKLRSIGLERDKFTVTSSPCSERYSSQDSNSDLLFCRQDISLLYRVGLQESIRNDEETALDKNQSDDLCSQEEESETHSISKMRLGKQQGSMGNDGDGQNAIDSNSLCSTPVESSFSSSFETQNFASCIAMPGAATVSLSFAF